jgi:aerotaxis receptor
MGKLTQKDNGEILYDDLYLLSETDDKGIITYTSESFARVAGYGVTELIGQPHNVVRHPDMPRAAFKDLWDSVAKKGFWTGFVKNLRKDGGFYWVYATVLKNIDKSGNVKYVSIRTKPNRDDVEKAEELYKTMK